MQGLLRPFSGSGEVAEWLKAPHSKCGILARVSGVRIPPSPPVLHPSQLVLVGPATKFLSEARVWRLPRSAVYFLPLRSAFAFICASSPFNFSVIDFNAVISARAVARSRAAAAILSCVSRAILVKDC